MRGVLSVGVRFPLLSGTELALLTQPSMSSITIDRKDNARAATDRLMNTVFVKLVAS